MGAKLLSLVILPWYFIAAAPPTPAPAPTTVEHVSEGELRLVDGQATNEGRLEIYHDGQWGTICEHYFGLYSAQVACRQLGLPGHVMIFYRAYFGRGSGPIHLNQVQCYGTENRIPECPSKPWGSHICTHRDDVGIRCTEYMPQPGDSEGSVRLMGGREGKNEGRLEIYHRGHWGTVCQDFFRSPAAKVVCRQLGLPEQGTAVYRNYFGSIEGQPMLLDNVECKGREESLTECRHWPWGKHNCGLLGVGVSCEMPYDGQIGDLRLEDGPELNTGRLEIYYGAPGIYNLDQFWGPICPGGNNETFTQVEARVACRQMGYDNGDLYPRTFRSFRRPVLDRIRCVGNEERLSECKSKDWAYLNCLGRGTVSITCYNEDSG